MANYYYQADGLSNPRWGVTPSINMARLSNPEKTVQIQFPENELPRRLIANFQGGEELFGTPLEVLRSVIRSDESKLGQLFKYKEGNVTWWLSREVWLLQDSLVFASLPGTPKRKIIIGTGLMTINSRLARLFKEKVLPCIDYSHTDVKILRTDDWVCYNARPREIITPDTIKDVLLSHIDDCENP